MYIVQFVHLHIFHVCVFGCRGNPPTNGANFQLRLHCHRIRPQPQCFSSKHLESYSTNQMYPWKPADCCAKGQTNGHCVGVRFQNYYCPGMIFANYFTQARIRKMKIYPKICVKLGMLGPKRRQFRHPTARVLLKFAISLPKIPTLPKATQMS